jgi:lysine/ornithine N-monooxygenase
VKLILIAHVRLLLPTLKQKPKSFVADGVTTAAPVNYFTFRDFFAGLRRLLLPFYKTEKVHPNSPGIALNQNGICVA